jgi:hypothetical protein
MKSSIRMLLVAVFISTGAYATKVPIPIEGASLNVLVQVQAQALVNQASTPDGLNPSFDVFVRRTRLLVWGDTSPNFQYLIHLDNANFGKYGNYTTPRAILQDAWVGWSPTGYTGGTMLSIDAGILLMPISRHMLQSTANFITADASVDAFRYPGNTNQAFRDTGVQIRGWALDKKIGFRGGVFEGYQPIDVQGGVACAPGVANTCTNPKRLPALRGFVNIDLIGSEEGAPFANGWLYGAYKWGKDPVLSVNAAGSYQSLSVRNGFGNLADARMFSAGVYLNFPMTEQNELVYEGNVYVNGNGTSSANSGLGISTALGYRFGFVAPYVAYDYFQSSGCDDPTLSAAQALACDGANSRNIKAGLNFFFNKAFNHVMVEFQSNHGLSMLYGPSNVSAASGYVPLSLDPATAGGPRRAFNANLINPAFWSVLVHWNVVF